MSIPGASAGTMICDARRCGSASGSVTAITIPNPAPSAPDENHLRPSITHSSPSRTARVFSPVGSEPETSGSVIEKNERSSPATSGRSQRSFCSVGAEQVQDLAVARIRGLAAEDELGPDAAADLLVEIRVGEESLPGPAGFRREVRRPEPGRRARRRAARPSPRARDRPPGPARPRPGRGAPP